MEKTILGLNKEMSIIILSAVTMLFVFLSGYSPIFNLISFLFVMVKSFVFLIIPLLIYILEKSSIEFKKIAGIYTSYFVINLLVTIIASVSIVNGLLSGIWKTLFDLTNLIILLSSLCVLIEKILEYNDIRSKLYSNTIMKIVYLIGNFISYPFLMFIDKQVGKKEEDDA